MIGLIWNWIISWIIGWGGAGLLVCIAAWLAWFFSPVFKPTLLHIAVGATIFVVASTYFFTSGYNKGWTAAIHAIAAQDQKAVDESNVAKGTVADCFNGGGTWDIASAGCVRDPATNPR